MIARAAQWNMSVFRPAGLLAPEVVAAEYVRLAARYENDFGNTKFNVLQTFHEQLTDARGLAMQSCKDAAELRALLGVTDAEPESPVRPAKRVCLREDGLVVTHWEYDHRKYPADVNPKTYVATLCRKRGLPPPVFTCQTRPEDRKFQVFTLVFFANREGRL